MAVKGHGFDFEEIDENDIVGVPRGRKSTADPALVAALAKIKPGKAVRVTSEKLDPTTSTYGKDKARVNATFRSAARAAGHAGCSIIWSPDGIPQIKIK